MAIGVIAVLVGIMLPVLGTVRDTTHRVVCSSNIRQIGLGITMYADDNRGFLPASVFLSRADDDPGLPLETISLRIGSSSSFIQRAREDQDLAIHTSAALPSRWDGIGLLYSLDYLEAPGVFYCPAHTGSFQKQEQLETAWQLPASSVFSNYQYRGEGPNGDRRLWQLLPRQTVILSDSLRPDDSLNHEDGANILRADLSVLWFQDTQETLVQLSRNGDAEGAWEALDGSQQPGEKHTDD